MSRAALERFLVARRKRVVRVATRLMAGERRGGRDRGKSDRIDALAVARAALRERIDRLPVAQSAGVELEIRRTVSRARRRGTPGAGAESPGGVPLLPFAAGLDVRAATGSVLAVP
jgi:transposase